jgi:hypothetical protein
MPKIVIDHDLNRTELFSFLKEQRKGLINQKKSMMKFTDAVGFAVMAVDDTGKLEAVKGLKDIGTSYVDSGAIRVKVVANTSLFLDSDMDVLLPGNASKSIKERFPLIKHLKDHGRTLDSEVGDVKSIYYQDIPLVDLGYPKDGNAQALIFETNIRKDYDQSTFQKYVNGKVNQHSIGLQYVKIDLAFKDEEDEKEMDFWNKYYPQIINPEMADERGYFFVVSEIKLLENSAVLFGSNSLTPTLSVIDSDTLIEPVKTTQTEPSPQEAFDMLKAISEIKFFK